MSSSIQRAAPRRSTLTASVALAIGLAGCAVGPDFKTPRPPTLADANRPYTEVPRARADRQRSGRGRRLAAASTSGQDIPAEWWQMFHSDPLDQLIRVGDGAEPDPRVGAGRAAPGPGELQRRLRPEAPAGRHRLARRAARARVGGPAGVPARATFNLYNASVNVSYTIDVFGATRRELEGAAGGQSTTSATRSRRPISA